MSTAVSTSPRVYLVSFEGVSASVGGLDISHIVELRLQAVANSVPQVTLLVDIGPNGGSEAVDAVSLGNASQMFQACRAMVRTDSATLSLSVTCRLDGVGGSSTETLSLSGWMLTDVALSPVQREGVCTASLTFRHPLFRAHLGGAVPGLLASVLTDDELVGATPLDVFIGALYGQANAKRFAVNDITGIDGATPTDQVREQLLSHLEKAAGALESSLSWTHGGFPAAGYLVVDDAAMHRAIADYAAPSGGNSVLQILLGSIVPECSLAVGGDYTSGKLDIGPFEPWASPSLTVADSAITSLDFPQTDPSPISGVRMLMDAVADGPAMSYHPIGVQRGGSGYGLAEMFYIPASELTAEYMYGPIQQLGAPSWLTKVAQYSGSWTDAEISDTALASKQRLKTAVGTPRGADATFASAGLAGSQGLSDYSAALVACAKAYFETSLMKDWAFTINTRLMFSADGGIICPGRVLRVTADGKEVLAGYVSGVEHVISVPSRAASSRVYCTHPRFGSLPPAITSSANALYV